MSNKHYTPMIWGFRILVLTGLLVAYPLARWLPVSFGWENGVFENAQFVVLLASGLLACFWASRSKSRVLRWFWCMVAPIWFILALRELSWGAALLQPIHFDPETGPVFSSTQQMAAKWMVTAAAAVALLGSGLIFFLSRQYRTLARLWRNRMVPWPELGMATLATVISASAEGKLPFDLLQGLGLSHGSAQVLEEFAEFWVYFSVALAQWRVHLGLQRP